MDIAPYAPGDENDILDLFEKVFARPLSLDWWQWRFLENPVDRPRILLAWDDDRLVAHYAVSPFHLRLGDKVHLAALSMTTMTDPDYAGQGWFPRLAQRLYADLSAEGYLAVVGFPNNQSHAGFVDKLGWSDIAAQHTLVRKVQSTLRFSDQHTAETRAVALPELRGFDSNGSICWNWSPEYFFWRVSPQSGNIYKTTEVRQRANGQVVATAVWKVYENNTLDIVYISAMCRDTQAILIAELDIICSASNLIYMATWVGLHQATHRWLERLGFSTTAPVTYFGGYSLQPHFRLPDASVWSISMLCSDVF